MTSFICIFK